MTTNPATSPGRFPEFIKGLISAIGYHNDVVPGWLCMIMQVRVHRIGARVAKLFEKLRAGTYRAPPLRTERPRAHVPGTAPRPRHDVPPTLVLSVPAGSRLPRRFGWMNYLMRRNDRPYTVGASTGFLSMLLQNTDLQAACSTCPALGRELRPLCHMLGLKLPDYLKLPPRAHKPRARAPRPAV